MMQLRVATWLANGERDRGILGELPPGAKAHRLARHAPDREAIDYEPRSAARSLSGSRIAIGTKAGRVVVLGLEGRACHIIGGSHAVRSVAFVGDDWLVAGRSRGGFELYRCTGGDPEQSGTWQKVEPPRDAGTPAGGPTVQRSVLDGLSGRIERSVPLGAAATEGGWADAVACRLGDGKWEVVRVNTHSGLLDVISFGNDAGLVEHLAGRSLPTNGPDEFGMPLAVLGRGDGRVLVLDRGGLVPLGGSKEPRRIGVGPDTDDRLVGAAAGGAVFLVWTRTAVAFVDPEDDAGKAVVFAPTPDREEVEDATVVWDASWGPASPRALVVQRSGAVHWLTGAFDKKKRSYRAVPALSSTTSDAMFVGAAGDADRAMSTVWIAGRDHIARRFRCADLRVLRDDLAGELGKLDVGEWETFLKHRAGAALASRCVLAAHVGDPPPDDEHIARLAKAVRARWKDGTWPPKTPRALRKLVQVVGPGDVRALALRLAARIGPGPPRVDDAVRRWALQLVWRASDFAREQHPALARDVAERIVAAIRADRASPPAVTLLADHLERWVIDGSTYRHKTTQILALAAWNRDGGRDLDFLAYAHRVVRDRIDTLWVTRLPRPEPHSAAVAVAWDPRGRFSVQRHEDGRLSHVDRGGGDWQVEAGDAGPPDPSVAVVYVGAEQRPWALSAGENGITAIPLTTPSPVPGSPEEGVRHELPAPSDLGHISVIAAPGGSTDRVFVGTTYGAVRELTIVERGGTLAVVPVATIQSNSGTRASWSIQMDKRVFGERVTALEARVDAGGEVWLASGWSHGAVLAERFDDPERPIETWSIETDGPVRALHWVKTGDDLAVLAFGTDTGGFGLVDLRRGGKVVVRTHEASAAPVTAIAALEVRKGVHHVLTGNAAGSVALYEVCVAGRSDGEWSYRRLDRFQLPIGVRGILLEEAPQDPERDSPEAVHAAARAQLLGTGTTAPLQARVVGDDGQVRRISLVAVEGTDTCKMLRELLLALTGPPRRPAGRVCLSSLVAATEVFGSEPEGGEDPLPLWLMASEASGEGLASHGAWMRLRPPCEALKEAIGTPELDDRVAALRRTIEEIGDDLYRRDPPRSRAVMGVSWRNAGPASEWVAEHAIGRIAAGDPGSAAAALRAYLDIEAELEGQLARWSGDAPGDERAVLIRSFHRRMKVADVLLLAIGRNDPPLDAALQAVREHLLTKVLQPRLRHRDPVIVSETLVHLNRVLLRAASKAPDHAALALTLPQGGWYDVLMLVAEAAGRASGPAGRSTAVHHQAVRLFALTLALIPNVQLVVGLVMSEARLIRPGDFVRRGFGKDVLDACKVIEDNERGGAPIARERLASYLARPTFAHARSTSDEEQFRPPCDPASAGMDAELDRQLRRLDDAWQELAEMDVTGRSPSKAEIAEAFVKAQRAAPRNYLSLSVRVVEALMWGRTMLWPRSSEPDAPLQDGRDPTTLLEEARTAVEAAVAFSPQHEVHLAVIDAWDRAWSNQGVSLALVARFNRHRYQSSATNLHARIVQFTTQQHPVPRSGDPGMPAGSSPARAHPLVVDGERLVDDARLSSALSELLLYRKSVGEPWAQVRCSEVEELLERELMRVGMTVRWPTDFARGRDRNVPGPRFAWRGILHELVANAVKEPESGRVVGSGFEFKVEGPDEELRVTVTSPRRCGVPDPKVAHVLKEFQRGKATALRDTGFGLLMVRKLVEHIEGTMTVEVPEGPEAKDWALVHTFRFKRPRP